MAAADDRSGPVSGLSSSPTRPVRTDGQHTATFEIAGWCLELSVSPGAAGLVIAGEAARYTRAVEPSALTSWATATTKLLSLRPAASARGRATIRAPFLLDREGQPSVGFEALVSEHGVGYRLLVRCGEKPLASLATTKDVVRDMVQAAAGVGKVARPGG